MGASSDAGRLAALIRGASSVVALTGAGISVPSGIPDFRSPGTGLWENVDPLKVAHIDVFRSDPAEFWRFYSARFATLDDREPNAAHAALAELERRGALRAVVTQNIDRLHERAGTRELIELHGTISHASCLDCGARHPLQEVRARASAASDGVPLCDCGRALKPDVVLFGELLPAEALRRAQELCARADLLLCIGSSLEVYPVAELPLLTLVNGGALGIVTQGPTQYDSRAAVRLGGDVADELRAVLHAL
jgi:NAD-dependent deacetylase